MGRKKKESKSPRAVAMRREADLVLSDYARKSIEKLLGGRDCVLELARAQNAEDAALMVTSAPPEPVVEFTETGMIREVQLKETVRIVLEQTKSSKMIVVKRSGELSTLIQEVLPKIRMKKANRVYVVDRRLRKFQISSTLEIPDGSRLFFAHEDDNEGANSKKTPLARMEGSEVVMESSFTMVEKEAEFEKTALEVSKEEDQVEEILEQQSEDQQLQEESEDEEAEEDSNEEEENEAEDDAEDEMETVEADLLSRAHEALQARNGGEPTRITKSLDPVQIDFASARKGRIVLPIDENESDLIDTIAKHTVTVVRAPTGSGKSTRIVQYILEHFPTSKMVVTEPRRIAAMSLADRVAFELGEKERVGFHVGYSIRTESKQCSETRILFCTVGVLLRRISFDPNLEGITHVIVDEAHERDVLTDTLLIFLRKALNEGHRPDLKIVILSATIDTSKFKEYFACRSIPSAEMSVEGFCFPVETLFLDDLERRVGRSFGGFEQQQSSVRKDKARTTSAHQVQKQRKLLPLDVLFVSRLVQQFVQSQFSGKEDVDPPAIKRSVLIFVSGKRDISRIVSRLEQDLGPKIWALPLHSQLSSEDQRKVFATPRDPRKTKVIVATNIAETSITIDDCGLVIDTCRVKESRYDADSRAWHLEEALISRSAMKQRRGRAGRTAPGVCYHLVYEDEVLEDQPVPGMRKDSLEDSIMLLKAVRNHLDAFAFFGEAIDPPEPLNVLRILEDLSDLGVIRGQLNEQEDATELTPLGFALTRLGTDCRKGKLLILGLLLGCLDPVLTIAATLDGKSPFLFFSQGETARKTTDRIRRWFGEDDFTAMVHVRDAFIRGELDDEAIRSVVSISALKLNEQLRREFVNDLVGAGFITDASEIPAHSKQARDWRVVRCCLAGGLFPHVGRIGLELALVTGPHELVPSRLDYASTLFRAHKEDIGAYFVYHQRARIGGSASSGGPPRPMLMNVQRAVKVSPLALALLGGGLTRVRPKDHTRKGKFTCVRLGHCWLMRARPKDAVLIQQLRRKLDEAFLGMFERRAVAEEDEDLLEILRVATSF